MSVVETSLPNPAQKVETSRLTIILILGALNAVSPFSIDLYLPAFAQVAGDLHTTVARVSLSLSTYFIGLSVGQLVYGPLLDRFGRRSPLYAGLGLFILCSIGCSLSTSVEALIALRFLQALGGCAAQVASVAMVRDFFPASESVKVFSLLMLILGVSPLLAPTIGGIITTSLGWQWLFILLALIVTTILLSAIFLLPSGHLPDRAVSLRLKPIINGFLEIMRDRQFFTYSFAGAFSFAGLFVYVASSPLIFIEIFHVSKQIYGLIFGFLSLAFIGSSQLNIALGRRFTSDRIFFAASMVQLVFGGILLIGTLADWYGLYGTIAVLFFFIGSVGINAPNASALALAPFKRNAGRASALLGFIQMGLGAALSACVGLFDISATLLAALLLTVTTLLGVFILLLGSRNLVLHANDIE